MSDSLLNSKNSNEENGLVSMNGCLSLNIALDNFKLVYNPKTKQLEHSNNINSDDNQSDSCSKISLEDDLKNEISIKNISSDEISNDLNEISIDESKNCDNLNGPIRKYTHKRNLDGSFSSTISTVSEPSSSNSAYIENTEFEGINKRSLSGFFTRKLFGNNLSSQSRWSLNSKKSSSTESLSNANNLVASSSALIQHKRPLNLPAKNDFEERKHQNEYKEMLEAAKKKEIEINKVKKKKQEEQIKQEEQLSLISKEWINNIIPSWNILCNLKQTRELWWKGLPSSVRGKVWKLALGNQLQLNKQIYEICFNQAMTKLKASKNVKKSQISNRHLKTPNISTNLYEDCNNSSNATSISNYVQNNVPVVQHSKSNESSNNIHSNDTFDYKLTSININTDLKSDIVNECLCKNLKCINGFCEDYVESNLEIISLDISRTFPNLRIFQNGGPYYDTLHDLLATYACYRPEIGYIQGMSFIAAILILNMDAFDAFICFANLINRPLLLAAFSLDQQQMHAYYSAYNELFKLNLPKLFNHFNEAMLTPDLYLLDWIYTIYAKAMPLDIVSKVWDIYIRDGDEFIFKTALGVLHLHHDELLKMDFLTGSQFLVRLPDDLSVEKLFKSIQIIKLHTNKMNFLQLVDYFKNNK